jgi:hypothetical protein
LEEFRQQQWRDEATGRVNCINIEYWVNNAQAFLDNPDDDSEGEDDPVVQVQPSASNIDHNRTPSAYP